MPLYKRTPFGLADPPHDLKPSETVYQIRFTKEILRDYQEYLNRLNFYRQRVWTCKVTGKMNLTYEEALVSERRAAEKVQEFPAELVPHVLRIIQFSTLSLQGLVDAISAKLQENLFEGIELHGKKDQSVCPCKILKVLEDGDTIRYKVGWLDKDKKITDTSIVNQDDLIRKKPPFSRNVLKAFVRDSTSQSAPWVVHEKLAKKHGILTEPPKQDEQNGETNKRRKIAENGGTKVKKKAEEPSEEPVKYPIDDLLVRAAANDPVFTTRPSLCTSFKVPMDCVGDLLMVWDFCSSFSRLLNLWRFSLEDFENAICYKDKNLALIVESHAAILHLLIKDEGDYFMAIQNKKRKPKITLLNWTEFLFDFLEMKGGETLLKDAAIIKRGHYCLVDSHVKLTILQELVAEALATNAIRARLDECMDQQQALKAKKREEIKKKREDRHLKNEPDTTEASQKQDLENGNGNSHSSKVGDLSTHPDDIPDDVAQKIKSSKRNHIQKNGEKKNEDACIKNPRMHNENGSDEVKNVSAINRSLMRKRKRIHENEEAQGPEHDKGEHLEREMERLSIRTSPLGKDRNYNRYWFFRHEGRLFVESSDSKEWGYYTTKEELDALLGSLNPKGERERALKRQLEKHYHRISMALQKRSREVTNKVLLEEADLRRSTRVHKPRFSPAGSFLTYVNKWKKD